MKNIRIGAVISNSPVGEIRQNLENMLKWIPEAKAGGAAVICFPELNITGYSTRRDIFDAAQPIPGAVTDELCNLSISENIVILAGMAEKTENQKIYASHLVVGPKGDIGVYRKLHLAPPERGIYTPGNKIPVFKIQEIKFGIQLCYDAHFPELSTYMTSKQVDVIFIPHASPRGKPSEKHESWMKHLPARAYDNSIFVVACNQTGNNNKGLNFPGNAVVLGPSGNVITKALSGNEKIVIADLKADELERVRNHEMRYFFPNKRSDLF
jgi:predicted amidohydrolase